jgi:large subunit ribosomal protein L23
MTTERHYTVLVAPHVSEKISNLGDASNQYAFKVMRNATKGEIRAAVENIFNVKVIGVSTMNVKGKVKRNVSGTSRRNNWKKAYVRLAAGQTIDFVQPD